MAGSSSLLAQTALAAAPKVTSLSETTVPVVSEEPQDGLTAAAAATGSCLYYPLHSSTGKKIIGHNQSI